MSRSKRDYRHVDKDPIIDLIRYGIEESAMTLYEIAHKAGIKPATIQNWLYGTTKRPQNYNSDRVLLVVGITRDAFWVETGQRVLVPEATKQRQLRLVKGGKRN